MRITAYARLARGKGRTIRCAQIHSSAASMTGISAYQASNDRLVRGWLISIAALIAIMVLVGGATRLTESGRSLVEFKTIFWWEWSHRLLGRVIGAAYLLPFVWFLWRGVLGVELRRRLWLIF